VELKGLRGSAAARIDDKGRLKVPTIFRAVIQDQQGPDVFVTSLTGECVRIYPMPVWLEIEQKASQIPDNLPARLKFLDRVNYYGQTSELDGQGRVVIPSHLRESASIVGDVRVFGRIQYLEVWNDERFAQKLQREPWTDDDGLSLSEHGI
jgi:MraZ protein